MKRELQIPGFDAAIEARQRTRMVLAVAGVAAAAAALFAGLLMF